MQRVDVLVVDTGPFIKGVSFDSWSKKVVTVKDVISEIKDANTRQKLQALPYELTFREPSQSALHHVTEFSKKTGDYHNLSPVDLRVIALTYQLECEVGPQRGAHLNADPMKSVGGKKSVHASHNCHDGGNNIEELEKVETETVEEKLDAGGDIGKEQSNMSCTKEGETGECSDDEVTYDPNNNVIEIETDLREKQTDNLPESEEENKLEKGESDSSDSEPSSSESKEKDDDGGQWITPENIQQVCKAMGGALEEEVENVAVGCLTTDYAIQNVLMQIGLNVISLDGMLIRRLQTYALQCKACFKTCFKFGKVFCPFCGNRSLIKVHVEVQPDGSVHYWPLSTRQFSHKGLRYSLPLPKGGRQPNIPVITPNQRNTFRLPRSREKVDPLDPDYVARGSPFRSNDVTSRGVQIAFRQGGRSGRKPQEGWRKNPNQLKKKKKK